jgi:hypothetical protein
MNDDPMVEQREASEAQQAKPYGYYALLIALYNLLYGAFLWLYCRSDHPLEEVSALDVGLLSLATLRLSKAISEDEVTAVFREPLATSVQAGERRPGQKRGLRYALGKLVLCPTCTGTWIAALLGYSLHLSPRYTRPFLAIMSASGMSQVTDAILSLVYTDRNLLRRREQR